MNVAASSKRKLTSWTSSFEAATENLPSPLLLRRWAGIACIAGVMQRRVWVQTNFSIYPTFANLYTFLIAPPGVGKSALTYTVQDLWREVTGGDIKMHLCPSNVSGASIIDELAASAVRILQPMNPAEPYTEFHSLAICSNELAVLLPAFDPTMMSNLTEIWDCGTNFDQKLRKQSAPIKIKNPQINLLAATTPAQLHSFLPPGAWDQGFMSRVIPVYSAERILRPMFNNTDAENLEPVPMPGRKSLVADLLRIASLYGKFRVRRGAQEAINTWIMSGGEPSIKHPRFAHYNSRRPHTIMKLSMIAAVSVKDELIIEVEDFQLALDWLIEAEYYMEYIFHAMVIGGDAQIMEECYHFIWQAYARDKKGVPKRRIINFLMNKLPGYAVGKVFDNMVEAGIIQAMNTADAGGSELYRPTAKGTEGLSL